MTEFSYNTQQNETTKKALLEVVLEQRPRQLLDIKQKKFLAKTEAEKALKETTTASLNKIQEKRKENNKKKEEVRQKVLETQKKQNKYYNQEKREQTMKLETEFLALVKKKELAKETFTRDRKTTL